MAMHPVSKELIDFAQRLTLLAIGIDAGTTSPNNAYGAINYGRDMVDYAVLEYSAHVQANSVLDSEEVNSNA